MAKSNNLNENLIFAKGEKPPEELNKYFSGNVWCNMLSTRDDVLNCPIGNVTFEPGCRNNWHKHPGGQILLITSGRGYYQEEGKPAQELHPGEVVKILPNVKHWHGAAPDSWFVHLYIETNAEAGFIEWLEPVSDEDYKNLK